MFSGIRLLQFLFVGTSLLLAIYPYADIWFSDLFYKGNNQFVVQHYLVGRAYFYEFIIREIMMPLIVFLLLFKLWSGLCPYSPSDIFLVTR